MKNRIPVPEILKNFRTVKIKASDEVNYRDQLMCNICYQFVTDEPIAIWHYESDHIESGLTDKEVLEKAFEKAAKFSPAIKLARELLFKNGFPEDIVNGGYKALILEKDFLIAFFGTNEISITSLEFMWPLEMKHDGTMLYYDYRLPRWKFHGMRLLFEDNQIKYLEKFLDK